MADRTNTSTAGETMVLALGTEMDAYDALPAPIRAALADCPVMWSAQSLATEYAPELMTGDHATILRDLNRHTAWERETFAECYIAEHGHPLPHIAAGATPLRRLPAPSFASARTFAP